VCGHEAAGVVERVGEAVTNVKPGDHVVVTTLASCGVCEFCADGLPTLCRSTLANWSKPFTLDGEGIFNFAATSAFAERTLVRDVQCVAIPDDVPLTSAVVFGVGGVGLNVLQALRVRGADPIVAVDTAPAKEELAMRFGATHFLDGTRDDIVEAIGAIRPASDKAVRGAFNAGGMDWAFDCVAHPQVTWNALESLDWGGSVVIIGVAAQDAEFRGLYGRLTQVDRAVMGCRYGTISPHRDIPQIVELYRKGLIDLDGLVSSSHAVDDWETAVAELESGAVARGVLTF
jgi:S-(hydroxymethyl)glutathione dehydrogenase/alcohol dehydrogenase